MFSQSHRLTEGQANDQLLYFTSSSLTEDDQTLVFISDRDSPIPKKDNPQAQVNLYALDRRSGNIERLTDNSIGYLRSYVYFEGLPYEGLGLASPCLHPASGDLYYLQGREVRCVNAHTGTMRTLAELPADHVTGFTHISDDNSRLCVPTIHESAFQDRRAIDATVQRLGLSGHIRIFDTENGQQTEDIEVDRGWVTHVQFQPGRNDVVLFNHEWPGDCGIRRVWLWDGQAIRRMREEGPLAHGTPRRREDWVCHEVWSRDGRHIFYHGTYAQGDTPFAGRSFIARTTPDGGTPVEVPFEEGFERYGHFTLSSDIRTMVSDGYAEFGPPQTALRQGEWISRLKVDWEAETLRWEAVTRHGSSWDSQDSHPHPIFSHNDQEILYTSDVAGQRDVYAVRIEA